MRSTIRRRGTTALAVLAGAALALAGCSGDTGTGSTDAPSGEATTAASTLVIGVTSDVDTLHPWKATQFNTVNVMQTLYGTLTEFDQDLAVQPGLATSWDVSDDGLTVVFHLRENVLFADGSAFDSADVKYSLDAIAAEETAAVASVEATDPLTVTVHLTGPDASLLSNLAVINMAMLSSDDTEEALNETPNGTGPFKLQNRVPNQSLTIARNDNYWGTPAPLDTIEFRVIPDETSIVSAMQSGNVQLAVFDDPLVAQSAEAAGMTIIETPQLAYHVLQLNATQAPLDDVNVRLALQCAIDRQVVLDAAALGEGEITGPITSPAFRSDPYDRPCPERDLDQARAYLAAAGLPDGFTLHVIASTGEYSTSVNEAQSVQSQLADVGITVEIETLESGAYVDRWLAADFQSAIALNGGRPDPYGMYNRYFISTGNLNQVAGYSSPELDELFTQSRETSDQAARAVIFDEISQNLEDNAVWIWLFTSYTYTATAPGVTGFVPMANDSMQYLRTTAVG
jgi:peptide/nickel transport system substrate-binding protein